MQSVSVDNVRKRVFFKSHVLSWRRKVYSDCEDVINVTSSDVPGLRASNWESTTTDGWSLDRWHQKTIGACRTKRPSLTSPPQVGNFPDYVYGKTCVMDFVHNDSEHPVNTEKKDEWNIDIKLIFTVYANIVKMLKNNHDSDMTGIQFWLVECIYLYSW